MKSIKLPQGEQEPAWPALFGGVPLIYLFLDPYQRQASGLEWVATATAFILFAALYVAAVIYWARPRIVQRVTLGMALLAVVFAAYRPSGVLFFIYVAAMGPIGVSGDIPKSAAIILAAMLATIAEWSLLRPFNFFPFVTAAEALLIGCATTFVARHHFAMKRAVKTIERERIARDLHDILGHTLSVIILKSELASRLMNRDAERARAEVADIERISRNALAEVREAIVGYRSGDLVSEIERAQSTLATAGVKLERRMNPLNLSKATERVLALVLREAITNIVRHSHANSCSITLQCLNGMDELIVSDNGVGSNGSEGMGMRGMRERVQAVGGTFEWRSEVNNGTQLVARMPTLAMTESTG
jgi:two-component system sensor histidine kinase DesK